MRKIKILDNAETLNHNQRWQYMIGLGKASKSDKALTKSLHELASSEVHYERILALMSAHGSFDKVIIARLLEDPSIIGMDSAVKLAAKHLDADQLIDVMPRLSKGKRMRITMALLEVSRIDIIECIYAKSCVLEKQNILLYTSETFFREHIDQDKIEGYTEKQWKKIARRFPSITYELIEKILKKSGELSWLMQQAVCGVLHQFYKTAPALGLSLLNQAMTCIHPRKLPLERYALLFPEAVAELIRKHPVHLSVSLPVTVLRKLKNEVLCALAERNALANLKMVFPKLHSWQRAALYKSVGETLRGANGALPLVFVKTLSKSDREEEALHAFNLRLLEARPFERLPYLAVLPFHIALPLANPFLTQPEGELRAHAVSTLVQCGRYYSSELDKILDFCLKRENEQDPVRLAMITALADLPPARWSETHLPKLKLIITAALQARDCSFQTMEAAVCLLFKMIMFQTNFVLAELPVLVERMGRLNMPSYESHISNADMVKLDSCLFPLVKTWVARDQSHIAVSLILSFGCRIKCAYKLKRAEGKQLGLIQLLIDLTQDRRGHIAKSGLDALIELDIREEVSNLIPRLIEEDSSWLQVNSVSEYLHRHHQNLLTPFLKPCIYLNRFSNGNTAILLVFNNGFVRWTANQQQIYANSLEDFLNSDKRNAWELYESVNRIGSMPSADLTPLINLAKYDAKDIALRDKALEALGRADAGRGVRELLQALNDNRAGIAIYALRRSVLEMSEKNAISLLSKAPRNKVTVLKEIIRLAGEFGGADSYKFLSLFAEDKNLHPDVQIALLRAFWKYLNNEDVWRYFHTAAQSSHAALARSTIRIPQEGLTPNGRNHLCTQLTLLLQNENAQIRMETLERLVYMPLGQANDAMSEVLVGMLEDVDTKICRLAAEAMLATDILKNDCKLVDAFAKVKHPKSVAAIVAAFQNRNFINVSELRNCAESLVHAILEQRILPSQALSLALTLLPPLNILTIIENIDNADLLHPGAVDSNLTNWNKAVKAYTEKDIVVLEAKLRSSKSAGIRRLGLGLLIESSNQYGWTEERCEYLSEYCMDMNLWISEAAGLIEPPQALKKQ